MKLTCDGEQVPNLERSSKDPGKWFCQCNDQGGYNTAKNETNWNENWHLYGGIYNIIIFNFSLPVICTSNFENSAHS